jgi:hypothetical protein
MLLDAGMPSLFNQIANVKRPSCGTYYERAKTIRMVLATLARSTTTLHR